MEHEEVFESGLKRSVSLKEEGTKAGFLEEEASEMGLPRKRQRLLPPCQGLL